MGGEAIETEAEIAERLIRENKEAAQRLRDKKLIDDFSFLISTVVPSLLKNVFTFAFGGQIGTGPFFNDIGGNGLSLIHI